ncbi:MAG: POTRA domain-containing protein [Bradymonadaceae bacterium]
MPLLDDIRFNGFRRLLSLALLLVVMSTQSFAWAQGTLMDSVEASRDAPRQQTLQDEIDEAYEGMPIGRVEFSCDLSLCANPVARERFQELSGLYVGLPFSRAAMRRAQERLAKTGFFSTLEIHKELEAGRVFIHIEATGAVLIRRVTFRGNSPPPFETDLRKLLIYRPGQAYTEDHDRASAQLSSLESIYEREGYFGTSVRMVVQQVEDNDHLVDLVFHVDKGEELKICDIGIRGLRVMLYSEAREMLLTTAPFFSRRIPLMRPPYTTQDFRTGRDALLHRYREMGYFRARIVDQAVTIDEKKSCVQIVIDISEGPLWEIDFEGGELFGDDELRAQLPFFESGYVDREEIQRAQTAIRKLYETRGYPYARVRGEEIQVDTLLRTLRFEINEGPQLQISSLEVHGNASIPSATLLRGFGTQPFGLFDTGGYLQTDQLLADFLKLEAAYRERGFLQAVVERFAFERTARGDGLIVHIYVKEGPQTLVDRVDLVGTRVVPQGMLMEVLHASPRKEFVPVKVRADQSRIQARYSAFGYPLARVGTTCRLLTGEEIPCEAPQMPQECRANTLEDLVEMCETEETPTHTVICRRIRDDDGCVYEGGAMSTSVRVRHQIEEGPLVRVGEILLKGNFRTKSDLIYRELPLKTGALFDVRKLIDGQGNMRSLGLFDSVSIETIGLEEEEELHGDELTASLIISVEESRSRFLDFRFGVEGRDLAADTRRLLVLGETQYFDGNFLGRGQRFSPRLIGALDTLDLWRLGASTAQELEAAQEVVDLDYLIGAELIFSNPRFLKKWTNIDKLFLTITPFYMLDLVGANNEQVLSEEWGLRLELRKELFEVLERFYLTFGIEAKQAATWTPGGLRVDGQRVFSPRRVTGKLMPEITLDRRDSPLNPRKGFHVQVKPHIVSGDALAQGAEDALGDSYLRLMFSLSVFTPLWRDVTLAQGLRMGQIIPLFDRQTLVPPDERLYLGGVGSVRGFPTNTLGPIGGQQQPLGGEFLLNYNAELRYPLIKGINLYGATFFDAGLLVDCFDDGNTRSTAGCYGNAFGHPDGSLSSVRTAVGLGLRYLIVDQIPLLFDYGFVLNRRPGENFGSLHFNLGYTF